MIRLVLVLLLSLFTVTSSMADPAAIPADGVLRGKFTQDRTVVGFKKPLHSEGHFTISPTQGILWQVEKPFATTTVITSRGLTQQIDGTKTTDIPASRIPFLTHLYEMIGGVLEGKWSSLEHDFTIKRTGDSTQWQVELTPIHTGDPAMPIKKINVRGREFAERTILTRNDGSTDTLLFLGQKITKSPLSAAEQALFATASSQ